MQNRVLNSTTYVNSNLLVLLFTNIPIQGRGTSDLRFHGTLTLTLTPSQDNIVCITGQIKDNKWIVIFFVVNDYYKLRICLY